MSLRKVAGFLGAFGLAIGLVGGGVSAAFTDQVTAAEHINVGTFGCKITATTQGTIATDGKSVSYTPSNILSDVAGSKPFSFTVTNTGSIAQQLTVTQTALTAPFSSLLVDPVAPVDLISGATQTYDAGIAWTELENANISQVVQITYTVACNVVPVVPAP
jgi:predicted ribosomally synthesized peptide with SipW-like signal peptide